MRTPVLALTLGIVLTNGLVMVSAQEARIRVPAGFKAAAGTKAEPYTNTGWAQEIVHEQTGMALVYVPAGEFLMGSPEDEQGREKDEAQHRVTLTKGFYLGKYEVTQGQWEKVMGNNPSRFKGQDNPVEMVSWDDCQAFIQKLGNGFRLPTEAEWEHACRAGTKGAYAGNLADYGWYYENSGDARLDEASWDADKLKSNHCQTHPVGQKKPNAWGLYDMHGNVWEWCQDWYGDYSAGAVPDPSGAAAGRSRVFRGGGWFSYAWRCRSAFRIWHEPGYRDPDLGCRLAFSPAPGQ